jgi:hypothetical protein
MWGRIYAGRKFRNAQVKHLWGRIYAGRKFRNAVGG